MKLNTYLHFKDNAEEALNFYAKALGGKVAMMLRFNESPAAGECGKDMGPKIMHGRIVIGDNVIMASDCPPEHYKPQAGFSVNIGVDSAKEAETIFAALSEKAQAIIMPLAETFWAERFGMFVDQFGIPWMVNWREEAVIASELKVTE